MDHDCSDVIRMRFKGGNLFGGIVVVHPDLKIVGTADNPILAGDEAPGSDGNIGEFERLDDYLRTL